jgi:hypothetical protein
VSLNGGLVLVRFSIFAALSALSLLTAAFLSGWGPSPFYVEYIPQASALRDSPVAGAIWFLILYSPLLYALSLLLKRKT